MFLQKLHKTLVQAFLTKECTLWQIEFIKSIIYYKRSVFSQAALSDYFDSQLILSPILEAIAKDLLLSKH
jgi:hypothetical protein